jgi:hypothetical protein
MPSTDSLIRAAEAADHAAHHARPARGRWLLPLLQLLSGAVVVVARQLERANG